MTQSPQSFNEGYASAEIYDEMLPPHLYLGREDTEILEDMAQSLLGAASGSPGLRVLDIGAGSGRMTTYLHPYAASLHVSDKSLGMVRRLSSEFPEARVTCADTEAFLEDLHRNGEEGTYDFVGAFWSLSYPLLECFEETTEDGVIPADFEVGVDRARLLVERLVGLLAPNGHLLAFFFDSETSEQKLVTELWERIEPFPGSGRGFTWELLREGLLRAEQQGRGRVSLLRLPGYAVCDSLGDAMAWFNIGHLNSFDALVQNALVQAEIREFVERCTRRDGRVLLPSGVHIAHFCATNEPDHVSGII